MQLPALPLTGELLSFRDLSGGHALCQCVAHYCMFAIVVCRENKPLLPFDSVLADSVTPLVHAAKFQLGVGMVVVASPGVPVDAIEAHLDALGEPHYQIGRVVEGDRDVRLIARG